YLNPASPLRRQQVHISVTAREGHPLSTRWKVGAVSVEVASQEPLGTAQNRPLDEALLRDQLGRLGNTSYELATLTLKIEGQPFAPAKLLNTIRREATKALTEAQSQPVLKPPTVVEEMGGRPPGLRRVPRPAKNPQLHVLVRTPPQLEAAIEANPASITLDYLDLYGLKPSVDRIKSTGIHVRVATPKILKPGEERILEFLQRLDAPLLVRSNGMLETLSNQPHHPLTGDFSLNAANALTTKVFLDMGLDRITPTHDLNAAQIATLAAEFPADKLEVIAYGHLPVFHTEHCVFCRFLSTGTTYKDCGRPCETHQVALKDQQGRAHPVIADIGCRNTVFGAEAQEASAHLDTWLAAGIEHYRVEFAHETQAQTKAVIEAFTSRLAGRITSDQLARELRRAAPQGTTEGSLFVPQNYQQLPILQ
ncbi:MAG: DUF3656 domain-containing protein, partial [Bryobacteraceae bacterium]|nr:DUF3656 domain-containing protein [Bryobacteraceae bacterium]